MERPRRHVGDSAAHPDRRTHGTSEDASEGDGELPNGLLAGRQRAPLRGSGTPDDVADACVGLVGARYATGLILVVDGGLALR